MDEIETARSPRLVYDHAKERGCRSIGVPFRLVREGETIAVTCVDISFRGSEVPECTDIDLFVKMMREEVEPLAKSLGATVEQITPEQFAAEKSDDE